MDNASKAMIIVGEVLLGVIIISILVVLFNKVNEFTEAYHENADRQRLIVFNSQYTKYITNNTDTDTTYIYAEDVVTIVNQAIDGNKASLIDNEKIIIEIYDESNTIEYRVIESGEIRIGVGPSCKERKEFEEDFLKNYKLRIGATPENREYRFSCEMTLNSEGRINYVKITNKGETT